MIRYAVAILLLALTVPASAEDMNDANSILPGCKGTLGTQMWEQGRCAGFIEGLRYGVGGRDFCPPKEATRGQSVAVVIKYVEARPQRMREDFGKLAIEALTAAWPCKP
jgi:hypothetical protein